MFSDDPQVISNVNASSGLGQSPIITSVGYASPATVNFAALDNNGVVTPGTAQVTISAVSNTNAARGTPTGDIIGGTANQSVLYFNIGDIDVNYGCIAAPSNGGTANVSITFSPSNGFNENIDWAWTNTGGFNVFFDQSAGTSVFSGGYTVLNFVLTNNEFSDIPGTQDFTFDANITNGLGTATKHFTIPVALNATGCSAAAPGSGKHAATIGAGRATGTWKRGKAGTAVASKGTGKKVTTASAMPDLQIKSTDVTISPSVPQRGETVNVRFKVSNLGDAAASKVPVSLVVSGKVVATDTVDVPAAGSTLAVIDWNTANWTPASGIGARRGISPRAVTDRVGNGRRSLDMQDRPAGIVDDAVVVNQPLRLDAQLVIDPAATIKQKSTTNKSVALSSLALRPSASVIAAQVIDADPSAQTHTFVEITAACVGLRVGTGSLAQCEGADLDIMIEDVASARYSFNAGGIADLGVMEPTANAAQNAQFNQRVAAAAGHYYAVQLRGGQVGVFKVSAILSPSQLVALAAKRFNKTGRRVVSGLGGDSNGIEVGDVSGKLNPAAIVYFDLLLKGR